MNPLRILLFPIALLYGVGVWIRNLLFDINVLSSHQFKSISTISIGNLSTGGTGKTPHTEYLIRLLKSEFKVATLSRGYGRKSNGFQLASVDSTYQDVGDEPQQFFSKFPDIPVAVEAKRVIGIQKLLDQFADLDIILLDDAFQHRYVVPGISILLTEYSNLFVDDHLLPVGNLREYKSGMKRADIIIVTKSPEILSPIDARTIREKIQPKSYQRVYFSYFKYGELQAVFPNQISFVPNYRNIHQTLLVTGIAQAGRLVEYLNQHEFEIEHLEYPDHHDFTESDLQTIRETFQKLSALGPRIIITTEKDAMRFRLPAIREKMADLPLFYIPIEVDFHNNLSNEFNEQILHYVRTNKVNSQFNS